MPEFSKSILFQPDGQIAWEGDHECRGEFLPVLNGDLHRSFSWLCVKKPRHASNISGAQVFSVAKSLKFIDSTGCIKGCYNILPNGVLMNEVVEKFNNYHCSKLRAEKMEFPYLFDNSDPLVNKLTEHYAKQDRIFSLEKSDYKLCYAADPNLFMWLKDKTFATTDLPYTIYSPLPGFRKWKTGEIGLMKRFYQYPIPDIHMICLEEQAQAQLLNWIVLNSESMTYWIGKDWSAFMDINEEYLDRHPSIGGDIAKKLNHYFLMNVSKQSQAYYSFRIGLMVDAGYDNVMFFNLQMDETNGRRFRIFDDRGASVSIIHGTLVGGWPKMIPIYIGRGLAGISSKVLPIEFSPVQITIFTLSSECLAYAKELGSQMSVYFRMDIELTPELSLSIKQLIDNWQEYYIIIGPNEVATKEIKIQSWLKREAFAIADFIALYKHRLSNRDRIDNRIPQCIKNL